MADSPLQVLAQKIEREVDELVANERLQAHARGREEGCKYALTFLRKKGHHAAADALERDLEIPF